MEFSKSLIKFLEFFFYKEKELEATLIFCKNIKTPLA